MQAMTSSVKEEANKVVLKMNLAKTKIMTMEAGLLHQ